MEPFVCSSDDARLLINFSSRCMQICDLSVLAISKDFLINVQLTQHWAHKHAQGLRLISSGKELTQMIKEPNCLQVIMTAWQGLFKCPRPRKIAKWKSSFIARLDFPSSSGYNELIFKSWKSPQNFSFTTSPSASFQCRIYFMPELARMKSRTFHYRTFFNEKVSGTVVNFLHQQRTSFSVSCRIFR